MKTALVFGSSGLIGSLLVDLIIQNKNYDCIKLFIRSDPKITNSKLEIIKTDFNNLDKYKKFMVGDVCFFCIGTTTKNTPNKNEYKRVEYNIPVEIAKIVKLNSVNSFLYISSGFADPNNSSTYLKYKGQVEEELKKINFSKLAILRPSILLGNRKENRAGEKIGIFLMRILSPFFLGNLKKMKPIRAEYVANAMIYVAENSYQSTNIIESNQIVEINQLSSQ